MWNRKKRGYEDVFKKLKDNDSNLNNYLSLKYRYLNV